MDELDIDIVLNKAMKSFKKVIQNWGICELLLAVIFLPYSLVYIGFRMAQEWK